MSENTHEQPEFATQVQAMGTRDLQELLDFANQVQSWSYHHLEPGQSTFAHVAEHFGVPVERIGLAVEAHYWMFADDPSAPIAERRIEHEGE